MISIYNVKTSSFRNIFDVNVSYFYLTITLSTGGFNAFTSIKKAPFENLAFAIRQEPSHISDSSLEFCLRVTTVLVWISRDEIMLDQQRDVVAVFWA
jgi:hypothetical protein